MRAIVGHVLDGFCARRRTIPSHVPYRFGQLRQKREHFKNETDQSILIVYFSVYLGLIIIFKKLDDHVQHGKKIQRS